MSGGTVFRCKECGTSGDYEDMPKGMDPRPGVFRVICRDCIDAIKQAQSRAQVFERGPYTHQTETGIGHKGGASEDMAKLLSGSRAAEARKALISILKTPMTAEDASRKAGLDPDFISPRISELIKNGLVATYDRKGRSDRGNPCGRYIITDLAKGLAA